MSATLVLRARELSKHARRIASRCGCDVVPRPFPNPTLVAHGLIKASRWHLLTHEPPRKPIADLYTDSRPVALRIARLFSNLLDTQIDLLDNSATPADLKAHPRSVVEATSAYAMNPSRSGIARVTRKLKRIVTGGSSRVRRARSAAQRLQYQKSHVQRSSRRLAANPKRRNPGVRLDWTRLTGVQSNSLRAETPIGAYYVSSQRAQTHRQVMSGDTGPAKGKLLGYTVQLNSYGKLPNGYHWMDVGSFGPRELARAKAAAAADYALRGNDPKLLAARRANPKRRNPARTAQRFRPHGARPGLAHGGPGTGPGRAPGSSIAIAIGKTTATATSTASPTVHSPTSTSTSTEAQTSTDTDTSTSTDTRSPSRTSTSTNPRAVDAATRKHVAALMRSIADDLGAPARAGNPSRSAGARARRKGSVLTSRQRRSLAKAGFQKSAQTRHLIVGQIQRGMKRGLPHGRPRNPVNRKIAGPFPEIVREAIVHTVVDIGQFKRRPAEKRDLERYVRAGYLEKGRGGPFPIIKTVYAVPGYPFAAAREHEIDAMMRLPNPKKLPGLIGYWTVGGKTWSVTRATGDTGEHPSWAYILETPRGALIALQRHQADPHALFPFYAGRSARSIRAPRASEWPGYGGVTEHADGTLSTDTADGVSVFAPLRANPKGRKTPRRAAARGPAARPAVTVGARHRRGNRPNHKSRTRVGTPRGVYRSRARVRSSAARVRSNPRIPSALERAGKVVRKFQDRGAIRLRTKKMKRPRPLTTTAAELGKLVGVVYRSDKFDGKERDYEHDFSAPLPSLVTDPDGTGLHVVGGRYKIDPDGILN